MASNSSRVKVEYTDPSNVFPLISADLLARLPLRNLHWNSPTRPLRSIDSLYVELVPDNKVVPPSQGRSASSAGIYGASDSSLPINVGNDARRESEPFPFQKERRHQIPGLRQTPYLKIYLLSCDDVETYKASSKRMLREWIKEHTPPSHGSNIVSGQENHDAFEWMIIHVVLPSMTNAPGWPGRASSIVLDRIRADFNGSSKSAIDRVAQIPTKSMQAQGNRASSIPTSGPQAEYAKETSKAWEDMVSKMKSLILASFDLRVRQYEEDIKEKGSQRNIPGWNFCTFFVLKEGLSRGFESVGLVEDALIGYDELSVELQNAIRDEKDKAASGQPAGLFREHTQELLALAVSALQSSQKDSEPKARQTPSISILDSNRKFYRELILANNISAFDFMGYVFSRQFSLLSRMAKLAASDESSEGRVLDMKSSRLTDLNNIANDKVGIDLSILAEICRRAIEFITSAASTIRGDLRFSFKGGATDSEDYMAARFRIIEDLISSWTFTTSEQVLVKTNVASLSEQLQSLSQNAIKSPPLSRPGSSSEKALVSPPVLSPGLPPRTSSLLGRNSTSALPRQETFPEHLVYPQKPTTQGQSLNGMQHLAAQRAELCVVGRRALASLGFRLGWQTGWAAVSVAQQLNKEELDDISLEDPTQQDGREANLKSSPRESSILDTLQDDVLHTALLSDENFYSAYEDLTLAALRLYQFSGNQKSAEGMTADIAIVRFHLGEYEAAALYFQKMAPFYSGDDWNSLEICALDMYARCLEKLDRIDDYVQTMTKLLARLVQRDRCNVYHISEAAKYSHERGRTDETDTASCLERLILASKRLKEPISAPMENYFTNIHIDPYLRHFKNKDGFQLRLNMRCLMSCEFKVDRIKVKIVGVDDKQSSDIWLLSERPQLMKAGHVEALLTAFATFPGWYIVDKVMISCENIIFIYDLSPADTSGFFGTAQGNRPSNRTIGQEPQILVWPCRKALEARVTLCQEIYLEQPRSIVVEISSGFNDILQGQVVVRAGSAGLRLHMSEAELIEGSNNITHQPPVIKLGKQAVDSTLKIRIPYKLETEMKEIVVKAEVAYSTDRGDFTYGNSYSLPVLLPLGVNVQDIFKQNALFSKFSISASTSIPLRFLGCHLEGTKDFEAKSPLMDRSSLFISVKQPVSMIYKITRKNRTSLSKRDLLTRLSMKIEYQCLDEEICLTVQECLLKNLQNSDFKGESRLLLPLVERTLRSRLLRQDLERIGLLREIELGTFHDFNWERNLLALPLERRKELKAWLVEWHHANPILTLPSQAQSIQIRHIIIPVDVPQMHVVHTASLHLFQVSQTLPPSAVGQAIPAELRLKYSRKWDVSEDSKEQARNEELSFYYSLDANPDTWLIGGQRRAYYTAPENHTLTFPILLIPQRPGHLLLPTLDIRPDTDHSSSPLNPSTNFSYPPSSNLKLPTSPHLHSASLQSSPLAIPMSTDIDYRSHGQSVLVVTDARSVTVGLEPGGVGGGAWVVAEEGMVR